MIDSKFCVVLLLQLQAVLKITLRSFLENCTRFVIFSGIEMNFDPESNIQQQKIVLFNSPICKIVIFSTI